MSFIDNLFKRQTPPEQKSVPAGLFSFFSPTAMPRMGEKESIKAYMGWVYACTNAIAERVADIEITLEKKQKDSWQAVENTPVLNLLHDVNPFMSFSELMYATEAFQQLDGNTFWFMNPNGSGTPVEIWPLDPTRMTVVKDDKYFIKGYVYRNEAGKDEPFDIEDIIHFKRFNPNNPYRGMGTVIAAGLAVDTDKYAAEWQRNFFGNAAMPSGILSTEGKMSQEQYERLKMQWDVKYKGVANAHKMAILEGGMKWQSISPTSREMEFTQSRKDIRDEILAMFRVPKSIIGIVEDVNRANAEATEYIFGKYVVKPRMKFLVTKLNEFYLPMFNLDPSLYRLHFVDPVPENLEEKRAGRESGLKYGYLTQNEVREEIGREPVEGGDMLYVSNLVQPIPGSNIPEGDAPDPEDKGVKKKVTKGKPIERTHESKTKEQDYKQEQIALLHTTYTGLNDDLQKELIARIQQYKTAEPYDHALIVPLTKRLYRAIEKENIGAANDLVRFLFEQYDDWIGLVYNATQDGLQRIFEQSGKNTFADLGIEGSFDVQNPRALEWLSQHALDDTTSYTDTVKESISLRIQEGVELGLTNQDIADSISEYFTGNSDYQAMRMARTETINAYGQGNLEGFQQSDVISGKYWIPDAEACEICLGNQDDGVIALDDTFSSGDDAPAAHPNCECSLGGQTDEDA